MDNTFYKHVITGKWDVSLPFTYTYIRTSPLSKYEKSLIGKFVCMSGSVPTSFPGSPLSRSGGRGERDPGNKVGSVPPAHKR